MQRLGLVESTVTPVRRAPTATPWKQLSEEDQRNYARRMEVYAGAIDNMDDNIGRVLSYLRDTDQFENTLVLFCLLYTSPSPRDLSTSRMPSSA